MDAPPIQFARTEDGVDNAYWTPGRALPLAPSLGDSVNDRGNDREPLEPRARATLLSPQ